MPPTLKDALAQAVETARRSKAETSPFEYMSVYEAVYSAADACDINTNMDEAVAEARKNVGDDSEALLRYDHLTHYCHRLIRFRKEGTNQQQ